VSARASISVHRLVGVLVALLLSAMMARPARASDDVVVTLEQFGALRAFRPGDVTGMCVNLRSNLTEPIECVVQWDLPNADGDLVSHARTVTLTPGQTTRRWLYARLPPSATPQSLATDTFTVRVFEARNGARVRELIQTRFKPGDAARPSEPLSMVQGLIAIVGDGRMGLETLDAQFDGPDVPSMQEATRVMPGTRVADLPDRWEGLATAGSLVWAGPSPGTLDPERARAILEWVDRGGHLVIVIPEAGDPWSLRGGGSHALSEALPTRGTARAEGVEIEALLPVLSKDRELRKADVTTTLTVFDAKALDRGWKPLMLLPDAFTWKEIPDAALVAERVWGHGRITLVGLDVAALHARALAADGLPQADVFWNRILGRRADSPTLGNYNTWQAAQPPQLLGRTGTRTFVAGDGDLVLEQIGQTGQATGGVLSVLAFFVAYWVLAVPGSWLFLKRRHRLAKAWPVFAVIALLAAPVAWALGLAFGGSTIQVRHLSVADFILPTADDGEGAKVRRLRVNAWLSVALGGFGTTPVTLGEIAQRDSLLLDWSPPPDGNTSRFPDTAQASRDVDRPGEVLAPSRATATEMQAWSLAPAPTAWGRVAWVDEGNPVETIVQTGTNPKVGLRGAIRHGLPGPLRNVQIVHVTPWLYPPRSWTTGSSPLIDPSGLPPRPARMVTLSAWGGEALDLGKALYPKGPLSVSGKGEGSMIVEVKRTYQDPLESDVGGTLGGNVTGAFGSDAWMRRLEMLSLYDMLEPPAYRRNQAALSQGVVRVRRLLGRELDLSSWFTRPCVVVTGFLEGTALPAPLRVDGREPTSDGAVMVRFILPLPCEELGFVRPSP
jgi:hypothetical protein